MPVISSGPVHPIGVDMRILSLGAGVQSSTLALMIERGEVERVDCAIFADTGWEPKSVYTWLDWLGSKLSYPVYRVSNGNIRASLTGAQARYAAIPFFTEDRGMALRQCTNEYKLVPIKRKVRELLSLEKGERANGKQATMLIGISTDESQRMKPSTEKYMFNEWPLIDARMSRSDCLQWMARNGYPLPEKSSCIGCPYHSDAHWRDMRQNDPEAWADACEVDELIRDMGKMKQRQYMHRSLVPLRMATLGDEFTVDMFVNECEGMCGV
jgi:hypothetical protein